jgi:hypothetical protein
MTEELSARVGPDSDFEVSAFGALAGVFTRPGATFAALIRRPTWWLPFVCGMLLAAIFTVVMTDKVDVDAAMRRAIEKKTEASGQPLPKERMEQAIDRGVEMQQKLAPYAPTLGAVASAFFFFIAAFVLTGAGAAFGAEAKVPAYFAIFAYAEVPLLLRSGIAVVRLFATPDSSLTYDDLARIGTVGPTLLLPRTAAATAIAVTSSFDLFLLATVALLVVAFGKLPGLSRRTATILPVALWGCMVLLRLGWAAIFG